MLDAITQDTRYAIRTFRTNPGFTAGAILSLALETLRVSGFLGRTLELSDDHRGCTGAAVLTYGFWQREYGGRADILGKTISLDNSIPIVGVTEPRFTGIDVGSLVDVLVPVCSGELIHGENSILDWNAARKLQ